MEDGWGRRLGAEFRGLQTHLGLVHSCFLLVNLRLGMSDWATGDFRPQQHWLVLRCPRLGVQSEVSDFL